MLLEDRFWIQQKGRIQMSLLSDEIEKRQMIVIQRSLKTKDHVHIFVIFILLIRKFQETFAVI